MLQGKFRRWFWPNSHGFDPSNLIEQSNTSQQYDVNTKN